MILSKRDLEKHKVLKLNMHDSLEIGSLSFACCSSNPKHNLPVTISRWIFAVVVVVFCR